MDIYHKSYLLQLAFSVVVTRCELNVTNFIPPEYSRNIPPPPVREDTRHHINISIRFINLLDVNELKGSVQVACFFRVFWVDSRLYPQNTSKDAPLQFPQSVAEQLWRPDIVVENALMAVQNGIIKPTIFNGRYWGKRIAVSNYLSVRVSCSFQYQGYPFDIQMCPLHITNMGMTKGDIYLDWGRPPYSMDRDEFLKFQDRFKVRLCEDKTNPLRRTKLGEHPQKTLFFIMERNYMAYVVQLFVPSTLFALIAWLSILVPPTMLRTRLLLNSTNLLTVLAMFGAISRANATYIPKVSYLTGLRIWMYVCVAFVFSSMLVVIFDIRLIAMLTQPRQTQRVRKLVLGVYQRRRSTRFSSAVDLLEEEEEAHRSSLAASAPVIQEHRLQKPPAADAEGDVFEDASSRPVAEAADHAERKEVEGRMRRRRHLWLDLTAFYERMYLIAFPTLFCIFLATFFGYYARHRWLSLDRLLDLVRSSGEEDSGCWCTEQDDWPGCMTEDQYND